MTEVHVHDIQFLPEVGAFKGHAADGTVYLMKLSDADVDRLNTPGDDLMHHRRCARCRLRVAVTELVCAAEHIRENYPLDHPEQLNRAERALLAVAHSHLAEDTIARCFEETG